MRFLSHTAAFLAAAGTALAAGSGIAAADDTPPPIVETYDYPGAAQIFAEKGILLKKGDGHILLAECATGVDLLEVRSRLRENFCFRVTGATGFLSLELSDTYLLISDSTHTLKANYTINGVGGSATVAPGDFKGIGEGTGPTKSATLLELRV